MTEFEFDVTVQNGKVHLTALRGRQDKQLRRWCNSHSGSWDDERELWVFPFSAYTEVVATVRHLTGKSAEITHWPPLRQGWASGSLSTPDDLDATQWLTPLRRDEQGRAFLHARQSRIPVDQIGESIAFVREVRVPGEERLVYQVVTRPEERHLDPILSNLGA
jgi:hypothetical protein